MQTCDYNVVRAAMSVVEGWARPCLEQIEHHLENQRRGLLEMSQDPRVVDNMAHDGRYGVGRRVWEVKHQSKACTFSPQLALGAMPTGILSCSVTTMLSQLALLLSPVFLHSPHSLLLLAEFSPHHRTRVTASVACSSVTSSLTITCALSLGIWKREAPIEQISFSTYLGST